MNTEITLLGTGSSAGIPILGCTCPVCSMCQKDFRSSNRNLRTRSSIMISSGGKNLIIDTCPDFRYQMLKHKVSHVESVCYTHIHFDHTSGFDDLRAYSFWDNSIIDVYIPDNMYDIFLDRYSYFLGKNPTYKGTAPRINTHVLKTPQSSYQFSSFHLDCFNTDVEYFCFKHGNTNVFSYKFGSFLYLTDFKVLDPRVIEYLRGKISFAVISGINFKEQHKVHSTIGETQKILEDLKVPQAVITHICHDVDYYDPSNETKLQDGVVLGYDGMKIQVNI